MATALPRITTRVDFETQELLSQAATSHFYEKYGFMAFKDASNKLFITIADIRASF